MKRIQNARVHAHGVIVTTARRAYQIRFGQKPEAIEGTLIHTQSSVLGIAWKPISVLPRDFRLR